MVWCEQVSRVAEPLFSIILYCAALGCVIGLFAGMLGIGGGLLAVPALVYLLQHKLLLTLDLAVPMAVATSLSSILLTCFSSARAHYRLGNLNPDIIYRCGAGIAVGATLGAQLASRLPGQTLKEVFAFLVLVVAAKMLFAANKISTYSPSVLLLIIIGLLTGFVSALMGIGGGALLVPALVWLQVNMRQAIGCAAVCGFIIALFGTLNFVASGWALTALPEWSLGYVYLPASLGIVATSVFTAGVGARLGQNLNTQVLKRMFALFLVIISIRLLVGQ